MNNLNLSMKTNNKKIPVIDKIGYGLGNFSTGVSMQVLSVFLVLYCTDILKISGSLVGLVVSLGVIWDAITDPLMGFFSDSTKSKTFGRRHLYLLIGGIFLGVTNFVLWDLSPDLPTLAKTIILIVDLLAIKTFSTIYVTPYTALGAELTTDYDERTTIQSIKTIFFLAGLAFVSVVVMSVFFKSTPEFEMGQLNPSSYPVMGLYTSLIIVIFALISFFSTKKYIPMLNLNIETTTQKINISAIFSSFFLVLKNGTFRAVAFPYMFSNLVTALLTGFGLHVFTYTFALDNHQIATILGVLMVLSALSQPFWTYTSKKIDKKPSLKLSLIICITACIFFLITVLFRDYVQSKVMVFLPFAGLAGFGMGGLLSLPLSMIADVIDLDELKTGVRSEGSYYGCLTLLYKLAQSIALLLVGTLLDLINFNTNKTDGTLLIIGLVLSGGAIICFAMAYWSILKYNLTKDTVKDVQRQIAEKKAD
ncbi:MFS transporter [Clostridium thermarum]|uniref:MFS transporter n=1 Tax=Clostridium thermarum TaxID=1716543 RepID=UPI00111F13E4|nr:MFS transporter [Clostridium thermarum]